MKRQDISFNATEPNFQGYLHERTRTRKREGTD